MPTPTPRTSDAFFVFTSSAPTVKVGDAVHVSGTVAEFRPGGARPNLTTTELTSPVISVLSHRQSAARRRSSSASAAASPPDAGHRRRCHRRRRDQRRVRPGQRRHRLLREPGRHARPGERPRGRSGPTNDFGEIPVLGDDGRGRRPAHAARRHRDAADRLQPRADHPRRRIVGTARGQCRRRLRRRHRRRAGLQLRQLQAACHAALPVVSPGGLRPGSDAGRPAPNSSPSPPSTSRTSTPADPQAKFDSLAGRRSSQPAIARL